MKTSWRSFLFWSLAAATLAVYLVIVAWSLPKIAAMANGLAPFDMRPFGYAPEEARAFLKALSPEGHAFYLGIQHKLDLVFPGLLALTLVLVFRRLAPGWPGLILSMISLAGAGLDWAENAGVAVLLSQEPTDASISLASGLTVGKAVCNSVVLTAVLILLVRAAYWRWRRLVR